MCKTSLFWANDFPSLRNREFLSSRCEGCVSPHWVTSLRVRHSEGSASKGGCYPRPSAICLLRPVLPECFIFWRWIPAHVQGLHLHTNAERAGSPQDLSSPALRQTPSCEFPAGPEVPGPSVRLEPPCPVVAGSSQAAIPFESGSPCKRVAAERSSGDLGVAETIRHCLGEGGWQGLAPWHCALSKPLPSLGLVSHCLPVPRHSGKDQGHSLPLSPEF